jgi:hypothetical protein
MSEWQIVSGERRPHYCVCAVSLPIFPMVGARENKRRNSHNGVKGAQ